MRRWPLRVKLLLLLLGMVMLLLRGKQHWGHAAWRTRRVLHRLPKTAEAAGAWRARRPYATRAAATAMPKSRWARANACTAAATAPSAGACHAGSAWHLMDTLAAYGCRALKATDAWRRATHGPCRPEGRGNTSAVAISNQTRRASTCGGCSSKWRVRRAGSLGGKRPAQRRPAMMTVLNCRVVAYSWTRRDWFVVDVLHLPHRMLLLRLVPVEVHRHRPGRLRRRRGF